MEKFKILLVDVDSKIPNLALMKISSYYKSFGCEIELIKLDYSYYPHNKKIEIDAKKYRLCFVSILFKNNKERVNIKHCNVFYGGVGYNLKNKLPCEIENCEPDYSIYPNNNISYGFITRGCIRNCDFCVVPEKEGMIHQVNTVKNIVKHKKVRFLDNNILSFKDWKKIFQELIDKNISCSFNEGLDIRLMDEQKAEYLSKLNYYPTEYIFAFDNVLNIITMSNKLRLFKKYVPKDWKCKFFLYCHPNMNIKINLLARINWCRKNKVLPYIMRDSSCWDSVNRNFYIDLTSYCNQPAFFKKITFEQFMFKRKNNKERQKKSIGIYYNNI